ncbi:MULTISPECIES: lysylphosphatidylglycerol synthase transmembrane domain-containing protein [Saccharopolyspora]|uniref:lysylphosphatidylglycerol synthase transmembrane domain-containing protein n=1 Tax=Saccharopolyspora TaxID=1835 RepID=UPI00140469B6|nr:YbhN family protein [Saccharopolyspora elongata]
MRRTVQWSVLVAGVGVLAWQLPALTGESGRLRAALAGLRWEWVVVAALLGLGSLVAYGELHRRLLIAGGVHLGVRAVQAIHFAENALSTTLPALGDPAGFAYATYQLRQRDVGVALAVWSTVLSGVVATVVLMVLGVVGLGTSGSIPTFIAVVLVLGIASASWACWRVVTHAELLHRGLRGLTRLARRIPLLERGSWAADPDAAARRMSERVRLLRPSRSQWAVILAIAALSWVFDFLSLMATVVALGAPVSWSAFVMGFLVVQASIALQIMPGGAGLAEAGLLGVLVSSGAPVAQAMAIVLVYRGINWVGLAVVGWLVYAVQIHASPRRSDRS